MTFPVLTTERRVQLLEPPSGRVRMVLDTDTYNEIDDQFALVYTLLSPDRLDLAAIYAAPFHNNRSSGPEDGMQRSYEEILAGRGFGLDDSRASIETVARIRGARVEPERGEPHPFVQQLRRPA